MPKKPTSESSLVGQCGSTGNVACGQCVAGKARPVVLFDGVGNHRQTAFVQQVIAAHDSLQFREFANHVGQQVDLGEQRRPFGEGTFGTESFGNAAGDAPHSLRTVAERAELVVIDHRAERGDAVGKAVLAVLVVEEAGVREARAHDALVAADDVGRVTRPACWRRSGTC
jgi:hypothetical protein